MKTIIKFSISAAFLLLCTLSNIYSAPAYPFPVKVAQPNGDSITVHLHGDEFFHYTTTENGSVIMQDTDGYYKYAIIDENNTLLPGATNVSSFSLKGSQSDFINAGSTLFQEKIRKPASDRIINEKLKRIVETNSHSELRSTTASTILTGTPKALIILVNFYDKYFSVRNPQSSFHSMLNDSAYAENGGIGSAKDFYKANSQNQFAPNFVVIKPVTLPQRMADYGKNSNNAVDVNVEQMIVDACKAADQQGVNFSEFDNDKDGVLDYLYIFYAGYNEAERGNSDAIWSHASSIYNQNIVIDGIRLGKYACSSELKGGRVENNTMVSVGVFLHEFSHMLELPDLYDADLKMNGNDVGFGVGHWCTMGFGLYLPETGESPYAGGTTPPYFGAMERYVLGWINPLVMPVNNTPQTITLPPLSSSNQAYFLLTPTEGEFFSFEARKKEGWDSGLPGEGLLVFHNDLTTDEKLKISYNGDSIIVSALQLWHAGLTNIIEKHQCMDMLRANNNFYYPPGNSYPGTDNITTISDNTQPGFIAWDGQRSNVKVSNITKNADGSISFTIQSGNYTAIEKNNADLPVAYAVGKQLYFNNIKENAQIEIYDISGKKVFQKTVESDFSYNLPYTGQFIVKIVVNKQVYTNKVLAQ